MARHVPGWRASVKLITTAGVRALARHPDAGRLIAEVEQDRLHALDEKYGHDASEKDRRGWPWSRVDGEPWNSDSGRNVEGEQATCDTAEGIEADRDGAGISAGSATGDAVQELEDIAVEIQRRGALPSFVTEVRGLAAKYTGDAMDEAETVQRKCEDLATVPDVEDLMYEDAVGKIVAFREHSGWAEDRDLARVTIFIPELSEYRDITCDIDQLYHRNLVGPTGLIEQLVQRVDALCNELDPGGALVPAKADAAGTGGQADCDGDGDEERDAGGSGAGNPADTDSTDANADIADAAGGEDASEPEVPEFICKLVDTVNVQVWTKNGEGECILSIAAVIQEDEDLITLSAALTEAVASLDARRTDWLQRNAEALRDSVASAAVGPDEDARPAEAAALRPRASGSDDARAAVLVAEQES